MSAALRLVDSLYAESEQLSLAAEEAEARERRAAEQLRAQAAQLEAEKARQAESVAAHERAKAVRDEAQGKLDSAGAELARAVAPDAPQQQRRNALQDERGSLDGELQAIIASRVDASLASHGGTAQRLELDQLEASLQQEAGALLASAQEATAATGRLADATAVDAIEQAVSAYRREGEHLDAKISAAENQSSKITGAAGAERSAPASTESTPQNLALYRSKILALQRQLARRNRASAAHHRSALEVPRKSYHAKGAAQREASATPTQPTAARAQPMSLAPLQRYVREGPGAARPRGAQPLQVKKRRIQLASRPRK